MSVVLESANTSLVDKLHTIDRRKCDVCSCSLRIMIDIIYQYYMNLLIPSITQTTIKMSGVVQQ